MRNRYIPRKTIHSAIEWIQKNSSRMRKAGDWGIYRSEVSGCERIRAACLVSNGPGRKRSVRACPMSSLLPDGPEQTGDPDTLSEQLGIPLSVAEVIADAADSTNSRVQEVRLALIEALRLGGAVQPGG